MSRRSGSSARGSQAAASAKRTRRKIDFSDIPDSSAEQLRTMRRVGRPPLGERARQLIAIRIDPAVLQKFRSGAQKLGQPVPLSRWTQENCASSSSPFVTLPAATPPAPCERPRVSETTTRRQSSSPARRRQSPEPVEGPHRRLNIHMVRTPSKRA